MDYISNNITVEKNNRIERFLANELWYSASEGSQLFRERIAQFYPECKLPIESTELINRLRIEQSVLLTPGNQHGLDKGFRIGFGYDLEKTLNGLSRAEALMRTLL